jgi:hypothetical protein
MLKNRQIRRRWQLVFAAIIAAFLIARPTLAADFSGTWTVSYIVGEESQTVLLDVVQERSTLSGVGSLRLGIGDPVAVQIRQGWASSRSFRFELVATNGPQGPAQSFFGDWYKNELSGRTDGMFGSRVFRGTRQTQN